MKNFVELLTEQFVTESVSAEKATTDEEWLKHNLTAQAILSTLMDRCPDVLRVVFQLSIQMAFSDGLVKANLKHEDLYGVRNPHVIKLKAELLK